jgi:hypothetical protein
MSTSLNRRALVAGAAVLPAIAIPAAAQCVLGGDAELRRLLQSEGAVFVGLRDKQAAPRRV